MVEAPVPGIGARRGGCLDEIVDPEALATRWLPASCWAVDTRRQATVFTLLSTEPCFLH